MKDAKQFIIKWLVVAGVSVLGFALFQKLGWKKTESFIVDFGLIACSLFLFYIGRKKDFKDKHAEEMKRDIKEMRDNSFTWADFHEYQQTDKDKHEELKASMDSMDKKLDILILKAK
jgi:hypothetical protein